MTRESTIKAASAGLQAKSLDLTKYAPARVANRVRSTARVRTDDAAGAMGFGIASIDVKGERIDGDPLAIALLRIKYAQQPSGATFERALDLLLHRHGGISRPASETMRHVGRAALVEWLNDRCDKCRVRAEALQPWRCPVCTPTEAEPDKVQGRRVVVRILGREGDNKGVMIERVVAVMVPDSGCPKCKGLGRIFQEPARPMGMNCVPCSNSGLVTWKPKRRWRMVSELVVADQKARQQPLGLPYDAFLSHWHALYHSFIDVLRAADRRMGATIDLGMTSGDRSVVALDELFRQAEDARIETGREENLGPGETGASPSVPAKLRGRREPKR